MTFLKAAVGDFFLLIGQLSLHMTTAFLANDPQYTLYQNIPMGDLGVPCTLLGEKCLSNASCLKNLCVCPAGQYGDGKMECVDKDSNVCYLTGDPHLTDFSGDTGDVNMECTYPVASTRATILLNNGQKKICSANIFCTNTMIDGRYVVSGVNLDIRVTSPSTSTIVQQKYNITDTKIYQGLAAQSPMNAWGTLSVLNINGVEFNTWYDSVNKQFIMNSTGCGICVKFRPLNPTTERQDRTFGVSLVTAQTTTLLNKDCLCGIPNETVNYLEDRAELKGALDVNTLLLYDVAMANPPQTNHPRADKCVTMSRLIRKLPPSTAMLVLNNGSYIMNDRKLRQSLSNCEIRPLDVFIAYLKVQLNGATDPSCWTLQAAANCCPDEWKGPIDYKCQSIYG